MITVEPTKLFHCGRIARQMRHEHRLGLERRGVDAHRGVAAAFASSPYCRTAFEDGKILAMWGVTGSPLSLTGVLWCCLTQRAIDLPVWVVKQAKSELAKLAEGKELHTTVLDDDPAAQRFAVFLGFHVADNGPGKRAWSRQGRRQLLDHIRRDPDGTKLIPMGYHDEEYDQCV